ncbi:MAG: septum formation initiator family protein [Syntrophorhabdus sp.]|jgi:cell division protein FtsB|nr:septum formation initiator family protein [Syntrophorhabdus sp.]
MAENPVKRYGFIVFLSTIFFHLILMDGGIYDLLKIKLKARTARLAIMQMEDENAALSRELRRIRDDDRYLEEMVRKKYGLVREGEKVYRIEQ